LKLSDILEKVFYISNVMKAAVSDATTSIELNLLEKIAEDYIKEKNQALDEATNGKKEGGFTLTNSGAPPPQLDIHSADFGFGIPR